MCLPHLGHGIDWGGSRALVRHAKAALVVHRRGTLATLAAMVAAHANVTADDSAVHAI